MSCFKRMEGQPFSTADLHALIAEMPAATLMG
jgi:hypothetical protein